MNEFGKGGSMYTAYMKAYAFHRKHHEAKNDNDFDAMINDLDEFQTPLEQWLVTAVINELERIYHGQVSDV